MTKFQVSMLFNFRCKESNENFKFQIVLCPYGDFTKPSKAICRIYMQM